MHSGHGAEEAQAVFGVMVRCSLGMCIKDPTLPRTQGAPQSPGPTALPSALGLVLCGLAVPTEAASLPLSDFQETGPPEGQGPA